MFGPYAGNIAQMTLFQVTAGQLNTPLAVTTAPAGQATLTFHSCRSAMLDYLVEVQLDVIGPGGQRWRVPEVHLGGNAGYPVVRGESNSMEWRFSQDNSFAALSWGQIELEVIADDRYVSNLQDIVNTVSTDRLVVDVEFMQGVRHHSAAPAHLEATRQYLRDQMSDRDLPVENQLFNWQGSQGVSIIAMLEAENGDGTYYIIDGHYDTVTTTPGADDNASGTAGMLEAMRVLSQFNSETSIRFIGFDKEELGLRGARHYAASLLPGEDIRGMINFEMIGYTCRGEPKCVSFPNADTSIYNIRSSFATTMSDVFVSVGAAHVPGLKIVSVLDDGDPNFRRSDHAPFWDRGVDALFLSDGANFRTRTTTNQAIPSIRLTWNS